VLLLQSYTLFPLPSPYLWLNNLCNYNLIASLMYYVFFIWIPNVQFNRSPPSDRNRSRSQEQVSSTYPRRTTFPFSRWCVNGVLAHTYVDVPHRIIIHMCVHAYTHAHTLLHKREGDEKEERLVRNSDDSQGGGYCAGCGFRTTGSSRGTFMGWNSHRTAKTGPSTSRRTRSKSNRAVVRLLQ